MLYLEDWNTLVNETFIETDHDWEHCFSGLVAEVGEVAEKYQKAFRAGFDGPAPEKVVAELGDVVYYAVALASCLGYGLEDAAQMNYNKLMSRRERGCIQGEGDER